MNKGIAQGILHDRTLRRRFMFRLAMLMLAIFAIGLWGIDQWLAANIWRFVIWWGACGFLAVFTMLFAFYDALRVIREERERLE